MVCGRFAERMESLHGLERVCRGSLCKVEDSLLKSVMDRISSLREQIFRTAVCTRFPPRELIVETSFGDPESYALDDRCIGLPNHVCEVTLFLSFNEG